eukprot:6751242-Alexandrium_andersonii.AAC.1
MTRGLGGPGNDGPGGARDAPPGGLPVNVELKATERLKHLVGGAFQDSAAAVMEVNDQTGR